MDDEVGKGARDDDGPVDDDGPTDDNRPAGDDGIGVDDAAAVPPTAAQRDATGTSGDGEEESPHADPLLAWSLASFHVATLLTAGVAGLYAVGALGSLLQGVRTEVGLGLYLALWGLTWRTNRRWLAETRLRARRATVTRGMVWGAATGVGFLAVLLVVIALSLREVVFVAVLALVGTPVAAVVGALMGGGFALVDRAVVGLGRRLVGATRS